MVKRTKENYLSELVDLGEKLETFVSLIQNGKTKFYKELSIKLRILYVNKSGEKCLLQKLCNSYGFNVPVAIRYTAKEKVEKGIFPPSPTEGLVFEQINSVLTWLDSGDEIIDIFDALERKEILINGEMFSYKKIIEFAADKLGGAHIDENLPDSNLSFHDPGLLIGGLPPAQRTLFDLAKTSIKLIAMIKESLESSDKTTDNKA